MGYEISKTGFGSIPKPDFRIASGNYVFSEAIIDGPWEVKVGSEIGSSRVNGQFLCYTGEWSPGDTIQLTGSITFPGKVHPLTRAVDDLKLTFADGSHVIVPEGYDKGYIPVLGIGASKTLYIVATAYVFDFPGCADTTATQVIFDIDFVDGNGEAQKGTYVQFIGDLDAEDRYNECYGTGEKYGVDGDYVLGYQEQAEPVGEILSPIYMTEDTLVITNAEKDRFGGSAPTTDLANSAIEFVADEKTKLKLALSYGASRLFAPFIYQEEDTKEVTRTIHYRDDKGNTLAPDVTNTVTFTRPKYINSETGAVTYGEWTPEYETLPEVDSPEIPRHEADKPKVPAETITPDSEDLDIVVTYVRTEPEPTPCDRDPVIISPPDDSECDPCSVMQKEIDALKEQMLTKQNKLTVCDEMTLDEEGNLCVAGGSIADLFVPVDTLPDPEEADPHKIYMTPKQGGGVEEWHVVEEGGELVWDKFGEAEIDLSNYYTKSQVDALIENFLTDNDITKEYLMEKLGYTEIPVSITADGVTKRYIFLGKEDDSCVPELIAEGTALSGERPTNVNSYYILGDVNILGEFTEETYKITMTGVKVNGVSKGNVTTEGLWYDFYISDTIPEVIDQFRVVNNHLDVFRTESGGENYTISIDKITFETICEEG